MTFKTLAPGVLVSGQVTLEDLKTAAAQGVTRVVNNRPDDEEVGQLTSAEIEAAARAAGLDYLHAPVRGMPDADAVARVAGALADGASTLLYCRSGMRSAAAWALATSASGRMEADDIRAAAAAAGYDLSRLPL